MNVVTVLHKYICMRLVYMTTLSIVISQNCYSEAGKQLFKNFLIMHMATYIYNSSTYSSWLFLLILCSSVKMSPLMK